jgi:hypothetical protein
MSWAGMVSVPMVLLGLSVRRSGSIFIVSEVTTFGYRQGKICHERKVSLLSRPIPIYTPFLPPMASLNLLDARTSCFRYRSGC